MPASHGPLHVIQLSDPHLFAAEDGELRGVNTASTLAAVLAAIRRRNTPADLIAITGDLAQDESRGAYRRLCELLSPFDVPVLTLPGNHDDPALMADCLNDGRLTFCRPLTVGDWLMVPLNTHIPGAVHGEVGAAQLAALRRTLASAAQRFCAVWLHHHPLPTGSAWLDTIGLRDADALLREVDRHESVRAVLWGHVHQAGEFARGGILFASAPSTASQFMPRTETFVRDDRPPGWRTLTLHADGTVTTRTHWL